MEGNADKHVDGITTTNEGPDMRVDMDRNVDKMNKIHSSFEDPLRPREGRSLMWANVNMILTGTRDKKDKKLLDDVWGDVPEKQVTGNTKSSRLPSHEFFR